MPGEALTRKKRVRAGNRGSAFHMIAKVDELLAEESPNASRLSQLKMSLQEKLDVLKQLDGEMLELVDEEGLAEDIEQSDEFKERTYAAVIRIEECRVWALGPPSAETPRPKDPAGPSPAPPVNKVKLRTLTIRPFNGELTAWTTFCTTAVHDNPALSDIAKFNYLRSLLESTALDAIAGLTLTATNYREAVSILEKRFGNKQQIVAKHMDALLNVEAVTSPSHLKGLRHLHDLVESHVRSLKSFGVPSGSYGCLLTSVLVNKLPQELQLIVSWK